jgi:CheY-like chemotaxis protein
MSRTAIVKRMSSCQPHNVQVRVLVVEDHGALANRIGEGLRDAGFAVDVVYDGAAAPDNTTSPTTTSSFWIATCRPCTATASAASWCATDLALPQSCSGATWWSTARGAKCAGSADRAAQSFCPAPRCEPPNTED